MKDEISKGEDVCSFILYGLDSNGMSIEAKLIITCGDIMGACCLGDCFETSTDMNYCLQNYANELYDDAFNIIFHKIDFKTYVLNVRDVNLGNFDPSPEYVKERVNLFMPLIQRFIKDIMTGAK